MCFFCSLFTFKDNQVFPRDSQLLILDSGRGENIQDAADWKYEETNMQRFKKMILHIITHRSVVLRLFTGIKKAGWWSLCTLCLKGAEVLFEGLCRTAELQKSQVTMFPHLHVLLLLPPHSYHNLTNTPDNQSLQHSC